MSPRKAAAVIAGIVVLVGLLLSLNPLSVGRDGVDCGSAMAPSQTEALRADLDAFIGSSLYRAACDEEVSERRMLSFPLLGVGGLALVFLWLTRPDKADSSAGQPAEEAAGP